MFGQTGIEVSTAREPIRRRGEAARQRILDAAESLFFHQGINATGIEELAESGPCLKRTLYAYFGSKEELTRAYLERLAAGPDKLGASWAPAGRQLGAKEPELLGRRLALLYDGAAAGGTALNSTAPLETARELAGELIDETLA
jgi:AcrR family transcriptional regulator